MPTPAPVPPKSLRVAITGATGLVGRALATSLAARGHEVVGLTRGTKSPAPASRIRYVTYDPMSPGSIAAAVTGCDAVVHLAGESLFDSRWTDASMARIRASRVDATRALVEGLRVPGSHAKVLVSASAVGWYGPTHPDATVDESSAPGDDFLASVCRGWEEEALRATEQGIRVAIARIGIVIARDGGALAKMKTPFKLFVGGPIGNGRQPMSWIHRDDLVAMLVAMVEDERWKGPANATSPRPVTNKEFSKALGRALHRPAILPTPPFALRLLLGRVAEILTTGQRVMPRVAESLGFTWRFPTVDTALEDAVR